MKLKYYIPALSLKKGMAFKAPRGYLIIRPAINRFAIECWLIPAIPFIYLYELVLKLKVGIQLMGLYFEYVKAKKKTK